jgi:hypothetical protein
VEHITKTGCVLWPLQVYRATITSTGQQVAVKKIDLEALGANLVNKNTLLLMALFMSNPTALLLMQMSHPFF